MRPPSNSSNSPQTSRPQPAIQRSPQTSSGDSDHPPHTTATPSHNQTYSQPKTATGSSSSVSSSASSTSLITPAPSSTYSSALLPASSQIPSATPSKQSNPPANKKLAKMNGGGGSTSLAKNKLRVVAVSAAAATTGQTLPSSSRQMGTLRETTPPHSYKSPCVPSSPATPVSSHFYHSAPGPSSSSSNPSNLNSHAGKNDPAHSASSQKHPQASSQFSVADKSSISNHFKNKGISRSFDEEDDDDNDSLNDSTSDTEIRRTSEALFGGFYDDTNDNNDDEDEDEYNESNNNDSYDKSNDTFNGSLPSTPSSAYFLEPSISSRKQKRRPNRWSNNNHIHKSFSSSSRIPLPVDKVSAAVLPHFTQYSDDDKISLIKTLLSHTTRPVLSAIQEHISPLLKRDPFAYLPNEISLRIISFIDDPKTLARASQVSRLWYLLLSDDLTWKELCKSHHYRRLSAAVSSTPVLARSHSTNGADSSALSMVRSLYNNANRAPTIPEDANEPISLTRGDVINGAEDFVDFQFYPEATNHPVPTSYRSHFKHQYMLNTAWTSGGRLAAKYVINHSGVVTSLIMNGQYIVFALDNSKIYVFHENGMLIRSLFGHVMGVWALTMHGNVLVSGGCDRDVRVWNVETGECLQILRGHQSTVRCLQMANPTTAVSGSRDTTVRVWDVENGVLLRVLSGHTSSVRCIEVKGDIVVSGSYDCTAKIWRISDGQLLHTLTGHISQIYSLAFDGQRVATGSLDASIRIWDAQTGATMGVLQGHTSLVSQLQIRGNILVSGGSDGALRVWDLKDYNCVHRLAAHDNSVTSLQFDDDRIVSGGSDGRVKIWDMHTGHFVRELSNPYDSVWRIAFKDEKVAILASRSKTNPLTGQPENQIHFKLISFCPPGDGSAVGSSGSGKSQSIITPPAQSPSDANTTAATATTVATNNTTTENNSGTNPRGTGALQGNGRSATAAPAGTTTDPTSTSLQLAAAAAAAARPNSARRRNSRVMRAIYSTSNGRFPGLARPDGIDAAMTTAPPSSAPGSSSSSTSTSTSSSNSQPKHSIDWNESIDPLSREEPASQDGAASSAIDEAPSATAGGPSAFADDDGTTRTSIAVMGAAGDSNTLSMPAGLGMNGHGGTRSSASGIDTPEPMDLS